MKSREMAKKIEEALAKHGWTFQFDVKKDTLRIENGTNGMTVSLPGIIAKWENVKDKAIEDVVYTIEQGLLAMGQEAHFNKKEQRIFPVIRSTSFPTATSDDIPLITEEHTAETRIFYALDLGSTYKLIDEKMVEREQLDVKQLKEMALFNVRSLSTPLKRDDVAGNSFYFLNTNDGYDASRVLNEKFLAEFAAQVDGTMVVSIPHQDVLILADVRNDAGYDILAQMAFHFFAAGRVPVTALSFLYEEGELTPIFIMGKNKEKS